MTRLHMHTIKRTLRHYSKHSSSSSLYDIIAVGRLNRFIQ